MSTEPAYISHTIKPLLSGILHNLSNALEKHAPLEPYNPAFLPALHPKNQTCKNVVKLLHETGDSYCVNQVLKHLVLAGYSPEALRTAIAPHQVKPVMQIIVDRLNCSFKRLMHRVKTAPPLLWKIHWIVNGRTERRIAVINTPTLRPRILHRWATDQGCYEYDFRFALLNEGRLTYNFAFLKEILERTIKMNYEFEG